MSKIKHIIGILVAVILIITGCLAWHFSKNRIAVPAVEQASQNILKSDFSLEFTNSWRTMNASDGIVGTLFYIRWWREYFLQEEGDLNAFEILSRELASRHWTTEFSFLPLGYAKIILPHSASAKLAPWWQPETNTEPMMSVEMSNNGRTVYIYGFKKATNTLIYIHIIENRK